MEVSFKINSWHAKLYRVAKPYRERLPDNFCPYARTIILFILTLPLTWWTFLLSKNNQASAFYNQEDRVVAGTLVGGVLLILEFAGIAIIQTFVGIEKINITYVLLGLPVSSLICFILYFLFRFYVWLINEVITPIFEKIISLTNIKKNRKTEQQEKLSFLKTHIKARKQKVCPKINWK